LTTASVRDLQSRTAIEGFVILKQESSSLTIYKTVLAEARGGEFGRTEDSKICYVFSEKLICIVMLLLRFLKPPIVVRDCKSRTVRKQLK
jgi:hypothetical protein